MVPLRTVLLDIRDYPTIKVAQGNASVRAGYAQMSGPLDVFPVRLQLKLVAELIKKSVQGLFVKHLWYTENGVCRLVLAGALSEFTPTGMVGQVRNGVELRGCSGV